MKVVAKTEEASTSVLMSLRCLYQVLEARAISGAWESRASRFICAGSGVEAAWGSPEILTIVGGCVAKRSQFDELFYELERLGSRKWCVSSR